jgi:hypothetical protein
MLTIQEGYAQNLDHLPQQWRSLNLGEIYLATFNICVYFPS